MRCHFMRDGHIGAVQMLTDAAGAAAITQVQAPFEQYRAKSTCFEVWDRARCVRWYPPNRSRQHEGDR